MASAKRHRPVCREHILSATALQLMDLGIGSHSRMFENSHDLTQCHAAQAMHLTGDKLCQSYLSKRIISSIVPAHIERHRPVCQEHILAAAALQLVDLGVGNDRVQRECIGIGRVSRRANGLRKRKSYNFGFAMIVSNANTSESDGILSRSTNGLRAPLEGRKKGLNRRSSSSSSSSSRYSGGNSHSLR